VAFCRSDGIAKTEPLPAAEIMRRVAENQDLAQKQRADFVYDQNIRVISRAGSGKMLRDEQAQYVVAPKEKKSERKRVSIKGKYWHKGHYLEFTGDPIPEAESIDGGLVGSFRDDLTNDDSKDGLSKGLFPLTSDEQKDLEFELDGERVVAGRPAYVVRFRPKNHKDYGWAGEALIDKEEFEPVTVYTEMSRKLPFLVRTMLGTDVPGLGFTTQYTRVDKGIWFPSSFGTEFRAHAVYFFRRTFSISMENKNFRRTNVEAQIHYEPVQ
jgi:hypothetical protein